MWEKYLKDNFYDIKATLKNSTGVIRYCDVPDFLHTHLPPTKTINFSEKDDMIIYIHIPFCYQKCSFCSYYGEYNIYEFWSENYVHLLIKEIDLFLKHNNYKKFKLSSLYIGWWTPTLLEGKDIYKLMNFIDKHFIISNESELTIESVPNTITKEKAEYLKKSKFTRVEVWVQSFNEQTVKNVERLQKNISVYKAVSLLKEVGIDCIAIDLIIWLTENETTQSFINDNVKHVNKINPDVLNLYNLHSHEKWKDYDREYITSLLSSEIIISPVIKYLHDRRKYVKNQLGIGFWAFGQYTTWKSFRRLSKKYNSLNEYKNALDNETIQYYEESINEDLFVKRYFIRHLFIGIDINVMKDVFSYINPYYIRKTLKRIQNYVEIQKWHMIISQKTLQSMKIWTNQHEKYFSFCFLYIYEDKERQRFKDELPYFKKNMWL